MPAQPIAVVLDTCVLYPQILRDVLLRAAAAGLFRPVWTEEILAELQRNLPTAPEKAARTIALMKNAFPEAIAPSHKGAAGEPAVHPKDLHVLEAAIASEARAIVTHNTKDFPAETVSGYGVDIWTPDTLLTRLFRREPTVMLEVFRRISSLLRQPPMSPHELAEAMERDAPGFSKAIRLKLP